MLFIDLFFYFCSIGSIYIHLYTVLFIIYYKSKSKSMPKHNRNNRNNNNRNNNIGNIKNMRQQQQSQQQQQQYGQRQAFHIPEQEAQEDQAFAYLLAVRNQANLLKKHNRDTIRRNNHILNHKHNINVNIEGNKQSVQQQQQRQQQQVQQQQQHLQQQQSSCSYGYQMKAIPHFKQPVSSIVDKGEPVWYQEWKKQTINNWRCLVANFTYYHQHNHNSVHSSSNGSGSGWNVNVREKPMFHSLCNISLPDCQALISTLSQQHYHNHNNNNNININNNSINNSINGRYYYLWIYSLLALHRSISPYTIFQALADINACLSIQQQIPNMDMLVVKVVMEVGFSQWINSSKVYMQIK